MLRLPNGRTLPPLFNFKQEVCYSLKKKVNHTLGVCMGDMSCILVTKTHVVMLLRIVKFNCNQLF